MRRVLLIRTSALGDVVHGLPVLAALAANRPDLEVGWAVDEVFAPLLDGHAQLRRVLPVALRASRRTSGRLPGMRRLSANLREIRRFGADVAIDLMGNWKGAVIALASRASRRIGFGPGHRREPASALLASEWVTPSSVHVVDRGLELLKALGIPPSNADFAGENIPPRSVNGEALALLDAEHRTPILIQPGAGWPNKQYPAAAWGDVARRLAAAGHPIRVLSSRGEEGLANSVVGASNGVARHWHAPTLPMLVSLLRGARLLLGGDTGPLHLAHALGTPVVAVMGPTAVASHGPYGAPQQAVSLDLLCGGCHRRFAEVRGCLAALPPARVAERALQLLNAEQRLGLAEQTTLRVLD